MVAIARPLDRARGRPRRPDPDIVARRPARLIRDGARAEAQRMQLIDALTEQAAQRSARSPTCALRPHERLMLALLRARAAAARAPYDGYRSMLRRYPPKFRCCARPDGALDAPARQSTAASALAEAARAQRGAAARSCARVVAHAPFADDPICGGPRRPPALARAPDGHVGAAAGRAPMQLVPIFDMCNHRPAAAAADASRRVVEVTSDGVAVLTAPEACAPATKSPSRTTPAAATPAAARLRLRHRRRRRRRSAAPPEDPEAVAAVLE